MTLLVGRQEGHPSCKNWVVGCWRGYLTGARCKLAQRMPLPLTVSCFSEIQIGLSFLVPAHLGSPGKRAVKWVCVCFSTITTRHNNASDVGIPNTYRDFNPLPPPPLHLYTQRRFLRMAARQQHDSDTVATRSRHGRSFRVLRLRRA